MKKSEWYYRAEKSEHPAAYLKELLEERNITVAEFAKRTNKPKKTIYAVLNGKSSITAEMAVKFSTVLGTDPKFWMNLQTSYDIYRAKTVLLKNISLIKAKIEKALAENDFGVVQALATEYLCLESLLNSSGGE